MKLVICGKPFGRGVTHDCIRSSMKFFETIVTPLDQFALKDVSITVSLIPNLQDDYNTTGFSGPIGSLFKPKNFLIELDDSINLRSTLITTAHEFTHVRQLASRQRQVFDADGSVWWMGTKYDPSQMHYYDLPWEIDAHGREYGMYDRYIHRETDIVLDPVTLIA